MMFAVADAGAMQAAMLLEQAVSVYRSYAGGRPEVERVKPELQRQRARAAAALPRIELGTVDLSSAAERTRESVRGKPLWEALVAFVTLGHPIPIERLRRSAKRRAEVAPLSTLMEQVLLSPSGQVVNRQPGSTDPEDDTALLGRMHEDIVLYHRLLVLGGIVPALEQFQLEHGLLEHRSVQKPWDFDHLAQRDRQASRGMIG